LVTILTDNKIEPQEKSGIFFQSITATWGRPAVFPGCLIKKDSLFLKKARWMRKTFEAALEGGQMMLKKRQLLLK